MQRLFPSIFLQSSRFVRFTAIFVIFNSLAGTTFSQTDPSSYNSSHVKVGALPDTPSISMRKAVVANAVVYGASISALYYAWYKNYPQSEFHTFNDGAEWLQMDKIGHVYSAYSIGRYSMEIWKATDLSRKQRIWIGGLSGAAYQTVIEVLDGFSSEWGWSWSDFAANVTGSGMLIAQELGWNEQRIQFKTSFHRKMYADAELNRRSDYLFGKSSAERALKDYNGQIYWLSTNLHSFMPNANLPSWLNIAVGTGAEGLFGARDNYSKNQLGQVIFDRRDIPRIRQWYLAPDIDFTKIKTRHKAIKVLLFVANSLKCPSPALELSGGKMKFRWLVF